MLKTVSAARNRPHWANAECGGRNGKEGLEAFELELLELGTGYHASRPTHHVSMYLRRRPPGVPHGVEHQAGPPHDVAAGKYPGKAGHLVAIDHEPAPIVDGEVAEVA